MEPAAADDAPLSDDPLLDALVTLRRWADDLPVIHSQLAQAVTTDPIWPTANGIAATGRYENEGVGGQPPAYTSVAGLQRVRLWLAQARPADAVPCSRT